MYSPPPRHDSRHAQLTALVVVPPLLKYAAGPLLGPAQLRGAAEAAGHAAPTLDLNIRYLASRLDRVPGTSSFVGDHDKQIDALRRVQARFVEELSEVLPVAEAVPGTDPRLTLTAPFEAVLQAGEALARGHHGRWIRDQLRAVSRPDLLGLSVLYAGQVIWALAVSIVGRELWPGVPVVWGGAHVTALRDVIPRDQRFARVADGYVFGQAERTFSALLDAIADGSPWPDAVVRGGAGRAVRAEDDPAVAPAFTDLERYGDPRLNLPVQASRGCAYGRCAFCTYPSIEGRYRPGPLGSVEPVIRLAEAHSAVVSVKDSLATVDRLVSLAELVRGRVRWSACTKLDPRLPALLHSLAAQGLDTIELGVETMHPGAQRYLGKPQSMDLLRRTFDAASSAGVGVVINLLHGIPHVDPGEEALWEEHVMEAMRLVPGLRAVAERNRFQLERLAPLARAPGAHGLSITGEWPWASVLAWEAVSVPHRVAVAGGRP